MTRGWALLAGVTLSVAALTGCGKPPTRSPPGPTRSTSPQPSGTDAGSEPLPPIPSESSGAAQAPVVWVGGILTRVTDRQLVIQESFGSEVTLVRLGQNATAFLSPVDGAWERVDPETGIGRREQACVETLLDGGNLLALRVFLGADCGPTG
jgi:hypothetical protein